MDRDRDYEDLYDLSGLADDELEQLIRDELADYTEIDPDDVAVEVSNGHVRLQGRVGTEHDYQVIEHVLTDVIGVSALSNEVVVDELRRGEQPEAADDALAERLARGDRGGANRTEDTAEHLLRDTAAELQGTGDVGEAIERGYSYNPPTEPMQEGSRSREDH
jgi:hypothetical protein